MRHGRVVYSDDPDPSSGAIYHIPSPFEPTPIDRLWPPSLRRLPLVVTLHDLIPAVFPDENMPDAGVRRFYWARAEITRQADRVLSVSEATAHDSVRLFGLRPEKLSITGGGVSEGFKPPASRDAVRAKLERFRPTIDAEYVLYTGGMDYRKNVDGLLSAFARLPKGLRDRYKLVLVGRLGLDDPLGPYAIQAASLGIADRVVFTGFVSEEELVLLYQGASLFVFPSLYEGFGLPVIEALACGAAAIVGRNSSLVELVDDEHALFDPADPSSIQAALTRALTDGDLLERLQLPEIRERFTWKRIAALTTAAYEEVSPRPRPARRRRRILCVAPLPALGADGEMTHTVLQAMTHWCDIDLLVDGADDAAPRGVEPLAVAGLEGVEQLRGGYDATVYWLGNSGDYALPMRVLRGRPGIVVAYNVRLTELYISAASQRPDLEPRRLIDVLRSIYGERAARELIDTDNHGDVAAADIGVYMAREAIAKSKKFFVHFQSAVSMARLEADAGDESKIDRLPLPLPQAELTAARDSRKPVAVFKELGRSREAERIAEHLRELGAEAEMAGGSRFVAADYSAAIATRGAPHAAGFASFVAGSVAAGLPTLLLGVTLGDHERFENMAELDAEPTDTELRGALQALDREPRPVTPNEATASVQATAQGLYDAILQLKSE
jgi:glycosyltransferase involved in cell wall biosynthesis